MKYAFEVEVAKKYGMEEATMLHNLIHWIVRNKIKESHFYEGTYWTYNTTASFVNLFPFWTRHQINRIIDKLKKSGAIKVNRFNVKGYDKTRWYSILDKSLFEIYEEVPDDFFRQGPFIKTESFFRNCGNQFPKTRKPIPDNKSYSKPNKDLDKSKSIVVSSNEEATDAVDYPKSDVPENNSTALAKPTTKAARARAFVAHFNDIRKIYTSRLGTFKYNPEIQRKFDAAIKNYETKEIVTAIHNAYKHDFHKDKNFLYLTPEYILRTESLERYLNFHTAPLSMQRPMVY